MTDKQNNKMDSSTTVVEKKPKQVSIQVQFLTEELISVQRRIDQIAERQKHIQAELDNVNLLKEALTDKLSKVK